MHPVPFRKHARANFSTPFGRGVSVTTESEIVLLLGSVEALRDRLNWGVNLVFFDGIRERRASAQQSSERGGTKLKAILYTVILVFAIYCAVKIVPVYVSNYQLQDKMQEQARFAIVNRYTEEQIRDNIFKVVLDLEIPVKREEIKVVSSSSVVKISMDYTVPIDLLVYKFDLHFTPSSENRSLT